MPFKSTQIAQKSWAAASLNLEVLLNLVEATPSIKLVFLVENRPSLLLEYLSGRAPGGFARLQSQWGGSGRGGAGSFTATHSGVYAGMSAARASVFLSAPLRA